VTLRRGDVLLFRGGSKLGQFTMEGQRLPGQKYKWPYTHVALVVKDGHPASDPFAEIVEGASHVRRNTLFERHADDMVWCFRPVRVPEHTLELISRDIENRVGEPYSMFELLTKFIDTKAFGGRVITRWLTRPIWGSNCDGLIAEPFSKYGHPIAGKKPWACTPNDIADWLLRHPEDYIVPWNGYPREWQWQMRA
jgi:hypothetical protein